eukprot:COSAG06_NODE_1685_length_8718_cov_7.598561_7_plen_190_part_00
MIAWWISTPAAAAVEIIDLSGCGLAGATKTKWNGQEYVWEKIDSNMDGFIALCTVLGKVRTVRLADCALGARSTAELAKVFRDADAALTKIDVRKNEGRDETVLAVLRAAAPARCKVLADAATKAGSEPEAEEGKPVAGCPDWVQYRDDEGTPYYYNLETEATQWELPKPAGGGGARAKQKRGKSGKTI